MEASKVLQHDDDMHECHQRDRINRMDKTIGQINVSMATLTEKVAWILRLNWVLVTAIVGTLVAFGIHSALK